MSTPVLSVGTRGSALALAQARLVVNALRAADVASRLVVIETDGDRRAPDTAWGEGAFVAALEAALLDGRVDLAVHSAKDVPTDVDPRLGIAAYLPRADPRDALVVPAHAGYATIDDLPAGARVGTDSPRRTAFLRARRPDLDVHPLHGNVDTRLRRLDAGETDALVLACAGLDRLGLAHRITERIAPAAVPPAPGQGAIAVEVRAGDAAAAIAALLDDADTRCAVEAERAFLRATGGGCRSPFAAIATVADGQVQLLAGHADPRGIRVRLEQDGGPRDEADGIARRLAARLTGTAREDDPRVLVLRSEGQAAELLASIAAIGLRPVHVPAVEIRHRPSPALRAAARDLSAFAWGVVTSANGVQSVVRAGAVGSSGPERGWAAVGDATGAALEHAGLAVGFKPSSPTATRLAGELPIQQGDRILVVRGELAGDRLATSLRSRGARVEDVTGYETVEGPTASRARLRGALDAGIDAIVLTSASTARGLVALGRAIDVDVAGIRAVCIGEPTASEARRLGFGKVSVASSPAPDAIAAVLRDVLGTTAQRPAGDRRRASQPEVPAHGPA